MRFFLTSETSGKAYYYCNKYELEIEHRLKALENQLYGEELNYIMIVAIIMIDPWPERRLFKRKEKAADIRLIIPYKPFIIAKPEKKFEMMADNTIRAVQTLEHKVSKKFDYTRLIRDMGELLPENTILPKE